MALGFFPSPYPDELLYSLCARYGARVRYSNVKSVTKELFGPRSDTATIDLPSNLSYFATALPAGTSLTLERLINGHTLLPFFSAFIPPERVLLLKADMQSSRGPASYMRSGIMGSRISTPEYLRFCPVCVQEDERQFGEAYWHRIHQLSGIEICPTHRVFLEKSSVSRCAGRDKSRFITAYDATRALPPRRIDPSDHNHQVLLHIACDAAWLLKHPISGTEFRTLHNRYVNLLVSRGLAAWTGGIRATPLLGEFGRHYTPTLLQLLHCEFTGSDQLKTNWLLRLVRPRRHVRHPLYHLLLMQFLGCTAEEFFRLPTKVEFFGNGPWPCLNPVAEHYRESIIQECIPSPTARSDRIVAIFSCECGFSYARSGPDSSPDDKFRIGRVISYGQAWEAKLKEVWENTSLSLRQMARTLGVDSLTLRRHATRLKLSFSRLNKELKPLNSTTQLKGKVIAAAQQEKRRHCRSKWLSAMKQKRGITLKALRHKLPREYAWLLHNDSEWVEEHKPTPQPRKLTTTIVDWKRRDAEYAAAVRSTASCLKDTPGRPMQVTRTAIGRALGALGLLRQKLNKMPLTAQVLVSVVETREQYAVRRVRWAAELYRQEGLMPREWQLMMRACVYSLRGNSAVKCAIEVAMRLLESELLQSYAGEAASQHKET